MAQPFNSINGNLLLQAAAASTANIAGTYTSAGLGGIGDTFTYTSTGAVSTDSVGGILGQVIFLHSQTAGLQNGLYVIQTLGSVGVSQVLVRHPAYSTSNQFLSNVFIQILGGSTFSSAFFILLPLLSYTVGTTALTYRPIAQAQGVVGSLPLIQSANGLVSNQSNFTNLALTTPTINGVTNGSSAASGVLGEIIKSVIAAASAVALTSGTPTNITSISLTAGQWVVEPNVSFMGNGSSSIVVSNAWASLTSATLPDFSLTSGTNSVNGVAGSGSQLSYCAPTLQVNVSTTTTVYLSAQVAYTGTGQTACGGITATRIR